MRIKKTKRFIKSFHKIPEYIKDKFDKQVTLFENNPFTKQLKNHALN